MTTLPMAAAGPVPAGRRPVMEVHGLTKTYAATPPIRAVRDVHLRVSSGELFGLLGPNGAGKSTLVGMCTTRIRPTAGAASVAGLDVVRDAAQVKRRIGVVTQTNTLDRSLTLRENLSYHGRYFGATARDACRRADELLERFRLADRAAAFPDQISGGMAQRLQVARAIAHRPVLLFLDEPSAGLDPQSRIALWDLVGELRSDGLTVVLTTHDMEEADRLSDRVAIVDHGRLLVCDTPRRLKDVHGAHGVVELAFGSTPDDRMFAALGELAGVDAVERIDGGLRLHVDDHAGLLARIVAAVGEAGLRDLSVQVATLESVFIALTGRDLRD